MAEIPFSILGVDEPCCGSVLKRIGHPMFEQIAKKNIDRLNSLGIEKVVFSCAGCFRTMKIDYPRIGELEFEPIHITQLMNELIKSRTLYPKRDMGIKVTYHDPCHLGRHNQIYDEPRSVIGSIPGVSLIEMQRTMRNSRCCGAGGGLKAGFPEVQQGCSITRIRDAEQTGSDFLVTSCPFCYQSLREAAESINTDLKVKDMCELVKESLQ
jgi:heterodisulfide reductase subunit D